MKKIILTIVSFVTLMALLVMPVMVKADVSLYEIPEDGNNAYVVSTTMYYSGNEKPSYQLEYVYENGKVVRINSYEFPSVNEKVLYDYQTFTYDANGNMTGLILYAIVDGEEREYRKADYTYDEKGLLVEYNYYRLDSSELPNETVIYENDEEGRVKSESIYFYKGAEHERYGYAKYAYEYDGNTVTTYDYDEYDDELNEWVLYETLIETTEGDKITRISLRQYGYGEKTIATYQGDDLIYREKYYSYDGGETWTLDIITTTTLEEIENGTKLNTVSTCYDVPEPYIASHGCDIRTRVGNVESIQTGTYSKVVTTYDKYENPLIVENYERGSETEEFKIEQKYVYEYKYVHTYQFIVDGKVIKEATVAEGSTIEEPVAPTKKGYTFVGWDKAFSVVDGDIVITAVFEKKANTGAIIGIIIGSLLFLLLLAYVLMYIYWRKKAQALKFLKGSYKGLDKLFHLKSPEEGSEEQVAEKEEVAEANEK